MTRLEFTKEISDCLSSWKFESLGDHVDKIVTVIMARRNDVVYHNVHFIWETHCKDVVYF